MSGQVVLTGMVLTAMPVGDYDKRITILTKERGKITAFARGARRPNSQLLAVTNPFCFGEFELYEGKSAYNLTKANISNYFRELAYDVDRVYYGFYFMEFASYYCQENNDEIQMLKLLYQSLRALSSQAYDTRLIRNIFELKAMTINGEGPSMFACMHCHTTENLRLFSVKRGGMFCSTCGAQVIARPIQEATRYTMQYIVSSPVEKVYSFKVSENVLDELTQIMHEYMAEYVRHKFKSLEIIAEGESFLG